MQAVDDLETFVVFSRGSAPLGRLDVERWLGAGLNSQEESVVVIRTQGVGLAASACQRLQEQASLAVTVRVGGDERFQDRDRITAAPEGPPWTAQSSAVRTNEPTRYSRV